MRCEWVSRLFAEAFPEHDWRVTTYHEGLFAAKALDGPVNYHVVLLSNRWEASQRRRRGRAVTRTGALRGFFQDLANLRHDHAGRGRLG